jgi:hypothetical protein
MMHAGDGKYMLRHVLKKKMYAGDGNCELWSGGTCRGELFACASFAIPNDNNKQKKQCCGYKVNICVLLPIRWLG